ncbi:MAG: NUMOD3 domain-containing DNA-binding protein [Peptostreptococcaceae bacterium]
MNHYVYIITNLINRKKYIGKRSCSCPIDKDIYMGSGVALGLAKKKYGIENFKKDILLVCDLEEQAYQEEEKAIELVQAVESDMYYNISHGGKGAGSGENNHMFGRTGNLNPMHGRKNNWGNHTDDAKNKIRNRFIGQNKSPEHVKKISQIKKELYGNKENHPMFGKYHKRDTKEKLRIINTGKKLSDETKKKISNGLKGENNPNFGKTLSDETKMKIGLANKGRIVSDETRKKISEGAKAREVICITTLDRFQNIKNASEKYIVARTHITAVCKGKRKSAGKHPITGEKLRWMYLEDYEKQHGKIA